MRRLKFSLAVVCVVLAVPAFAANEKAMEAPTGVFDRAAHFEEMGRLHHAVANGASGLGSHDPLVVTVTAKERDSVRDSAGSRERKIRVGLTRELSIPMEFSMEAAAVERAHGSFGSVRGRDGAMEWAGFVRADGASGLRIHLTDFELPAGAELYAFSRDGQAYGPYVDAGPNDSGDFWTHFIVGDEVGLYLRGANAEARFTVSGVGYMTDEFALSKNLMPRELGEVGVNTANCSFNDQDCVQGANCVSNNSAVNTAKNAVAHILFQAQGAWYICSGGLVADSDTSTSVPYFLTANHCISSSTSASSMQTFFFYTAACGSCPDPGAAHTNGATLVASNRTSDYTLMRLSQPAPSGAAFLGWSTANVANANGTNLYRISHPKGAPQSYSEQTVNTSRGTCRSWPRGNWIYSVDTLGATEGGSSGSPVVNGAGQVVGQLSGACGYNVNDVCDSAQNSTVDGAFAAYYTAVAPYLGSGSGGGGSTDADGDGFTVAQGDCNDNDKSIYPGANDTKGPKGKDGVDNDCDGVPDA